MTIYMSATFTGADTAAGTVPDPECFGQSFGMSSISGTPSYRILNNAVIDSSSANESLLYVDGCLSDGIFSVKVVALPTGDGGLIIRVAAVNSYVLINVENGSRYGIYNRTSGGFSLIGTVARVPVAGDIITVVAAGSTITVTVNGVSSGAITTTLNQTTATIGLRTAGGSSPRVGSFSNLVSSDDGVLTLPLYAVDSGSNGASFVYGVGTVLGRNPLLPDGGTAVAGGGKSIAAYHHMVTSLNGANVTCECWVNIPAGNVKGTLIKIGGGDGWGLSIGDSGVDPPSVLGKKLLINNQNIAWHVTSYSFGTGIYHVMVVRGTSGAFTCYVNGSSVATGTMSSPVTATAMIGVGGYGDGYVYPLSSTVDVDNVALYASALSSGRVTAHYNSGNGDNSAVVADSPVVWLPLNEGGPRRPKPARLVSSRAVQRGTR